MRSLNRVMLMGHLAADPELRQTKKSTSVANFPIAINRTVHDENGEIKESCDFHRIVVWKGLADVCDQYIKKGMAVFIEGRLVNRSFEDKDGNRHFRTEVNAERVDFLTWKQSESGEKEVALKPVKDEKASSSKKEKITA